MRDAAGVDATSGDAGPGDAGPADAGGDDTGPADAAADAALDAAADAAPPGDGVVCGEMSCTDPTFCCTTDLGMTGFCGMFPDGCGPGLSPNHCDGPEDCADTAECCSAGSMGNACLPIGTCDTLGGQLLCHDDGVCGAGVCCPAGPGSPWGVCSDVPC